MSKIIFVCDPLCPNPPNTNCPKFSLLCWAIIVTYLYFIPQKKIFPFFKILESSSHYCLKLWVLNLVGGVNKLLLKVI